MSVLRTRFVQDMQLHGFSPKTQACHVDAVRGLAKFYNKSPDLVTEEELRSYFLHLRLERKVARATATIALCGIKFFFQNTVRRDWTSLKLLRPPRSKNGAQGSAGLSGQLTAVCRVPAKPEPDRGIGCESGAARSGGSTSGRL